MTFVSNTALKQKNRDARTVQSIAKGTVVMHSGRVITNHGASSLVWRVLNIIVVVVVDVVANTLLV